ncbi:hypothetical protein [Pseudalkalibacillus decolorationis]|uniref:hypothetical protein n=1 Tax=Pseudalkalibacillus decolorationis TaxID=163879 RepID=UPI0021480051|nr:hypothetical protein [Pseudalkalibacillus decolorationis]
MVNFDVKEVIEIKKKGIKVLEEKSKHILHTMNSFDHTDIDLYILETEMQVVTHHILTLQNLVKQLEKAIK